MPRAGPRKVRQYSLKFKLKAVRLSQLSQNVEERVIHTPPKCTFDRDIKVELTVQADGSARPRFVYKSGRTDAETIPVEGKAFCLDMTYGERASGATAYIGLDFGAG